MPQRSKAASFSRIMSRDRWHDIRWCLSCVDTVAEAPDGDANTPGFDRLWKVSNKLVVPGRLVWLDEMMVKCKGISFD
jgi:hypothetical protein